ncbi:MAG TPA: lamin tail domain-containing protein [Pyrinomonadaceae bacterium]
MPRNNASTGTNPGSVLISEVRLRGPNGQNDEFIELYNNTDSPITISDSSPTCAAQILTNPLDPNPTAVCGWAIVDLQGGTAGPFPRVVIPSTPPTTIPARGHYLVANNSSPGYSLGTYATPDLTYTTPGYSASNADYTGLALFSTADRAQFNTTNRLDAVGFYGVNSLYREGNGLSSLTGTTVDGEYSFVRKVDISTAQPQDTGDNAADFVFVATTGATFNATTLPLQGLLGAPGPENLNSPIKRNITASGVGFAPGLVDPNCGSTVAPNQTKATTSFGDTLKIRRKYTNNTGGTVNRLRFRVVDITTLNSPNLYSGAAQADVRAVTSTLETVTLVCSGNGTQDVQGLTLEYADGTNKPDQSVNFGGHNSSVAAGSLSGGVITLTTPLANGDSIYVNFWIKIVSGGKFRFAWILEAN